jgi:glycosyltransferase involved in cell wall biosynthesis
MAANVGILFYPHYEISCCRNNAVSANNFNAQRTDIIPSALSLTRVGYHIHHVLTSLAFHTSYSSVYEPYEMGIQNFILANNLITKYVTNDMIYWDNAIRNFLSLSCNKIYYGVIEGPIINPPSNCTIIVPSKYVAHECEMINLRYDGIIPHGFDPLQFTIEADLYVQHKHLRDCSQTKTTIFYCLGKYCKRKGFERLFEVVRRVKNELKGNNFLVYLRTPYRPHYNKLLQGIEDVVIIKDASGLSDSAIVSEMSQCDCYLVPSLAEGFCLPALEAAFGCGKTVIYPNTSPYTDYLDEQIGYPVSIMNEKITKVSDTGLPLINYFRFKYWDIYEFAKSMIRVIENPKEAKLKGVDAYRRRSAWSIYNTYKGFSDYLKA